jgi:hypothetical protein
MAGVLLGDGQALIELVASADIAINTLLNNQHVGVSCKKNPGGGGGEEGG